MNYMWSHGIADASIGSGEAVAIQNMACRACDRSSTSIDVRHVMTMNAVYQLALRQREAVPQRRRRDIAIRGRMGTGRHRQRPHRPAGEYHRVAHRRRAASMATLPDSARTWCPACRSMPPTRPSTTGSIRRPSLPPPTAWGTWAATSPMAPAPTRSTPSLQKRFHVTERVALNFRASAFNLLNHPEYKTPGASVGSVAGSGTNLSIKPTASFGRITGILNTGATGTGAPRRIEFQFRAEF